MQKQKPFHLRADGNGSAFFPDLGFLPVRNDKTGASAIGLRVGDGERNADEDLLSEREGGEIVGRSLVGPSAFAVGRHAVGERHVGGAGQRDAECVLPGEGRGFQGGLAVKVDRLFARRIVQNH